MRRLSCLLLLSVFNVRENDIFGQGVVRERSGNFTPKKRTKSDNNIESGFAPVSILSRCAIYNPDKSRKNQAMFFTRLSVFQLRNIPFCRLSLDCETVVFRDFLSCRCIVSFCCGQW